jgi:hypothetical protein
MHWRVGRQLNEYVRHADVADVQDHLGDEVFGGPAGSASRIVGRVSERTMLSIDSSFQPDQKLHRIHRRAEHGAQLHEYRGRRWRRWN